MKEDSGYLNHILDCISRIETAQEEGYKSFMASTTYQDAVLRNLQVLAESTKHLSSEIKASQQEIDWREIAAFRNVLVHDYLGIDLEAIWGISQRDIPQLKQAVQAMLRTGQE